MASTLDALSVGEKALVTSFETNQIPLKLIEMGCVEGSEVQLVQVAPLQDPLYICINGTYLAVRKEVAKYINVEKLVS